MVAYKRKRSTRGRTTRRVRRRMNIAVPRRNLLSRPTTLTLKRTFYNGTWEFNNTLLTGFWRYHTFTTAQINNFAEIANLFDMYKINGIREQWRPRYDSVNNVQGAALTAPQFYAHIVNDPDSAVTPSGAFGTPTLNAFLEQGDRVKTHTLNKPFSVYFKPKIVSDIGADSFTTRSSTFLRTSNTTALHRGYHMFLQPNNMTTTLNPITANVYLDSFVTVYFTVKGLK